MARAFEIRRETELPATPEQVWAAVATGQGTASWLFPTGEGEPGGEGEVWGGHTVLVWDPPRHCSVRAEGPDGWYNALDYIIEARGSGALLRYAHSGIFVDDWDAQYDSAGQHTDFYLHSLGQYLRHFAGRPVSYVAAEGPAVSTAPDSFGAVRRELGLTAGSAVGDRVRLAVPGLDPVNGVLDYLTPNFIGVRSGDALYRFYGRNAFGMPVGLGHHLFAPEVDKDKTELAWRAWLDGMFS